MAKNEKMPEPMDSSHPERSTGQAAVNQQRVCYSLTTLMGEINALFDSVIPEYAHPDGRNTMLAVSLDLSMMEDDDRTDLIALLSLFDFDSDLRIEDVTIDVEEQTAWIEMKSNARTQDLRDTFGLAAALHVLSGEAEFYETEDDSQ